MIYIDRVLNLADSFKSEIMLTDKDGESYSVSAYKELSDIFKQCKNLVEVGVLIKDDDIECKDDYSIEELKLLTKG